MPGGPAAPEAPKPVVSFAEAAAARARRPIEVDHLPEESAARRAAQRGEELERFKKEREATGEEGFQEAVARQRSVGTFSHEDSVSTQLQFGSGYADVEYEWVELKFPEGASDRVRAEVTPNFTEAQRIIPQIELLSDYLEVTAKAKTITEAHRLWVEAKGPGALDGANRIIDGIADSDVIRERMPELGEMSPQQRRDFFEATLLSDSKLRTEIVRKVKDIHRRSQDLPEVQRDAETVAAEAERDAARTQIGVSVDRVLAELEGEAFPIAHLRDKIVVDLENGRGGNAVMHDIQRAVLGSPEFAANRELFDQAMQAEENVRNLEQRAATAQRGTQYEAQATQKLQAAEEARNLLLDTIGESGVKATYDRYKKAGRLLNTEPDSRGIRSGVVEELTEAAKLGLKCKAAEQKIAAKKQEAEKKEGRSIRERMRQEAELLRELDDVIPGTIADLLDEYRQEALPLERARVARKAKTEAERKVVKAMDERWIKRDDVKRTEEAQYKAIGEDMRFAAYHGEEGIRRMILRDLGLKDAAGNPIEWKTVDISTLTPEQQQILEQTYNTFGVDYKKKLFQSYFVARGGFKGRLSTGRFGEMNLKDQEWVLLDTHFGQFIDEQINSSPDAKKVMDRLKEKGIAPNDRKSKWLLYLLMLAGLGVAGVVTATGPAPAIAGVAAIGGKEYGSRAA